MSSSAPLVHRLAGQVDLLPLAQAAPERYPYLLESVSHGQGLTGHRNIGRYSILMGFPLQKRTCNTPAEFSDFRTQVAEDFAKNALVMSDVALPFIGGWFAFFAYDYAQAIEPILDLPQGDLPLAIWHRIPAAVIVDHQSDCTWLVAESGHQSALTQMQQDVAESSSLMLKPFSINQVIEEPEQKYLTGVERIKDYILAGDIFQVNLSREWRVDLADAEPVSIYEALRQCNPAPFSAYCDFGAWQILSSSPERLTCFDGLWVETRPIAGTRKRSDDQAADLALIEELISHPKERAEHIMLIDLERNDLGRICQPGSVEVDELMVVESYEHVHHIVSNVRGKLQSRLTPMQVVDAVFPGGTITGCPKVRCMQIVAELEQMPREAYTGSLGFVNRDGSLDLNILIRSMIVEGQQVRFRAGAGIVADSIAEKELEESRHKAKGLVNALLQGQALGK